MQRAHLGKVEVHLVMQMLHTIIVITDHNNNKNNNNIKNTVLVLCGLLCFALQGQHSVLSCTWNKPATKLFVGSVDHNLRVFGPPAS